MYFPGPILRTSRSALCFLMGKANFNIELTIYFKNNLKVTNQMLISLFVIINKRI